MYMCVRASMCVYLNSLVQQVFNALPYICHYSGLYLQDLTFINMVGDKLEDDKSCINFNKRWKQFNTVDKIRLAQTKYKSFQT